LAGRVTDPLNLSVVVTLTAPPPQTCNHDGDVSLMAGNGNETENAIEGSAAAVVQLGATCYVEPNSLDGETNPNLKQHSVEAEDCAHSRTCVEIPHDQIGKFVVNLEVPARLMTRGGTPHGAGT